jgi:hypothetical protein
VKPAESFTQKNNRQNAAKHRHQMNKQAGAIGSHQFDAPVETEIGQDRGKDSHVSYRQDGQPVKSHDPTGQMFPQIEGY